MLREFVDSASGLCARARASERSCECVRACVRACVRVLVRMRASVRARARAYACEPACVCRRFFFSFRFFVSVVCDTYKVVVN